MATLGIILLILVLVVGMYALMINKRRRSANDHEKFRQRR